MRTEFYVEYDLFDTTAISDATESTEDNAVFGNPALLKVDQTIPRYATLEQNYFTLDGTAEEMPDAPADVAFFSAACAGADGIFTDPPMLSVNFTENHTSIGLTLYFADEYPLEIEVRWYDLRGSMLSKKVFYPDGLVYFARNQVENYGKIEILFIRALPHHNAKLNRIEYGTTYTWGRNSVKTGKLVNDTDPISDKIKTDKLTFDFIDADGEFDIGNADGIHKVLQKTQRMYPYEVVDGVRIPLGTYFLDGNSTTKSISKLSAIDYKGLLAKVDFRGGRMYAGDTAGTIIGEIMAAAGITDYVVDEEVAAMPLYGTLKIQTCQKALREVLFACGACINTSRRTGIEIYKAGRKVRGKITRSQKFSTTLKTDTYVSDVTVKYKTWVLDDAVSEITKGSYTAGTHTIQLSNPASGMAASSGEILEQTPYYVVLQLDDAADVTISGQKYTGTELSAVASVSHVKAGETRNTKTFTGTLLNFEAAQRTAERILDYYQLQQIIQTKHLSADESAGDWYEIENAVKSRGGFVACIESLTTDLTGGFISTAKFRGYYKDLTDLYYGGELYADEEVGDI